MNLLCDFVWIANAYAANTAASAAPATTQQSILSMLPIFLIFIGFMYFVIIRPQAKRAKEHKNLVVNLKAGDEVLTSGGLIGKIEKMGEDFIVLSIAEGVNINIQKNAIITCVPKGTIKSI